MKRRCLTLAPCAWVLVGFLHATGAEEAARPGGRTGKVFTTLGSGHGVARAVAVQADGRIVVAGTQGNGRKDEFAVVRYTADGRLDTTFNNTGSVTTSLGVGNDAASGLGIQRDGKIVVGGSSNPKGVTKPGFSPHVFSLVRYTADGRLDAGFGEGGKVLTQVSKNEMSFAYALAIQPDGKIVMAGNSSTTRFLLSVRFDFAVARYLPNGRLDADFGRRGLVVEALATVSEDRAEAIALQSDGRILVAGYTHTGRYDPDMGVLRLKPDGTRDRGFGDAGQVITEWKVGSVAAGVAVQADGKILVVGTGVDAGRRYAEGPWSLALVRHVSDGRPDPGFGDRGIVKTAVGRWARGQGVTVQPDGKILVAGSGHNGRDYDFALVRYLPDGRLDPGFGDAGIVMTRLGNGHDWANALALQGDGKIIVAGWSTAAGGLRRFAVVRYNPDGSPDTGFNEPAG